MIVKSSSMKTPAIIFSVFLLAAVAVIGWNKKDSFLPSQKKVQSPAVTETPTGPLTDILFLDSIQHMGSVKEGEFVNVAFRFKNTGDELLIIKNVSASCGCTIPEKPEEPIAPGEMGVIKATFDSRGRAGINQKAIMLQANTKQAVYTLNFDVEVRGEYLYP